MVTTLCPHHAAVVAATIRAVPHLDPDERDRLADDLGRQCKQCTTDQAPTITPHARSDHKETVRG